MKHFTRFILIALILALTVTGCVRVTVRMPDESDREEIKEDLSAAGESVKEAVAGIPEIVKSVSQDITEAIESALPASSDGVNAGGTEIDPALIDEIDIDWVSGSVHLSVWDGDTVRFSESSDTPLKADEQLLWKIEDRELKIKPCSSKASIHILGQNEFPQKALTVEIPSSLLLNELSVSQVSSALSAESIRAGEIDIETVSGTALLSGIAADELDIETVSGEIEFDSLNVTKKISAESVSGSIKIGLSDAVPGFTLKPESISALITVPEGTEIVNRTYRFGDGAVRIEYSSVSGSLQIS